MRQYQKYKSVDSLWNLNFPAHWDVLPLCSMAREKSICNCIDMELLSVYLDAGVVPFSKRTEKRTNTTSKDLSKYQRVDVGDFVLNNQQAWRGSVGVSKYTGITSPAYIILALNDQLTLDYANYLFRSRIMVDQYLVASKGVGSIQRNLYWQELKRASVLVPPKDEQDQIVRYLDWKVSNINRLIHDYQRQIKLLEEQKKNTIYKAVTFGFNTDRNFKIIECIGKKRIPNDWDVVPLCSIAKEKSICNCTDLELLSVYLDEGVVKFSSRSEKRTNTTSKDLSKYQRVDPGDFVLNNQQAWRGSVGVSDYTGIISPAYIVLSLDDVLIRKYANYLFRSAFMIDQFLVVSKGVGSIQRNIYWPSFKRSLVIIPPKSEQQEIVDYIDVRCKEINVMIDKVNLQIEHLKEYRTRLISDVVTGQVDVRGVKIPDYTPEEYNAMDEEINDTEEVTDSAD